MMSIKNTKVGLTIISIISLMMTIQLSSQELMPIAELDQTVSRKGEIVWIDEIVKDAKSSRQYFGSLLGWKFKNHVAYDLAFNGNKPLSGIIEDKELLNSEKSSYWVVSIAVTDIEEVCKRIEGAGGKIITKPIEIEGRGKVALVQDNQNAYFALLENPEGQPKASAPKDGEWMWAELWTKDVKKAQSFYSKTLGIEVRKMKGSDSEAYVILSGDSYEFAGITKIPAEDEQPIWIPVLRVKDVESMVKRSNELGGSELIEPVVISTKKVALISTPSGAPFMIQEWTD